MSNEFASIMGLSVSPALSGAEGVGENHRLVSGSSQVYVERQNRHRSLKSHDKKIDHELDLCGTFLRHLKRFTLNPLIQY